jgi:hypothetical protein
MRQLYIWSSVFVLVAGVAMIGMGAARRDEPRPDPRCQNDCRQSEDAQCQMRVTKIIQMHNVQADDAAATLASARMEETKKYQASGQKSARLDLLEDAAFDVDRVSNKVIVNVSAGNWQSFEQMMGELDVAPPQIAVEIVLADVALDEGEHALSAGSLGADSDVSGQACSVFKLPSDTNLTYWVRNLQLKDRTIAVHSRPSVCIADKQVAIVHFGNEHIEVTPRVNPDGSITTRVRLEVSHADDGGRQVNSQTIETTVTAKNNETCIIGGMVSKTDEVQSGAADQRWVESVMIITPRVLRSQDTLQQEIKPPTTPAVAPMPAKD